MGTVEGTVCPARPTFRGPVPLQPVGVPTVSLSVLGAPAQGGAGASGVTPTKAFLAPLTLGAWHSLQWATQDV